MEAENKKKSSRQKSAAALKYRPGVEEAPILVAKGKGRVAEEIIRRAREANIPLQEDPVLVETLCRLEIGEPIPPELYQAVAEVLAFIISIDRKLGSRKM